MPHVSDQFIAYTGNTDLAILLNRDTFEPNPAVFAFQEASSTKDTWGMVVLVVRGLLRRPSFSGSPTVTFCSVHIHNVVAKKRDVSTDLLRRLHAHVLQHNVDFTGGDFNTSAFSTVGDVFADPEFSAPGNSFLWRLGPWRTRTASAPGVSSCRSAHMNGVWIHMDATSSLMQIWRLAPVTQPLIYLFFFICAPPLSRARQHHPQRASSAEALGT